MNRQFVVPFPFPSRDYFTIEARQRAARARALPLPPLGDTDRSLAAVKGISLESHASPSSRSIHTLSHSRTRSEMRGWVGTWLEVRTSARLPLTLAMHHPVTFIVCPVALSVVASIAA